jgi:hypothetical protein
VITRAIGYLGMIGCTAVGTRWLGWNGTQVLATSVFAGFIFGMLLFWKFRLAFALAGTTALLATGVVDIPHLIEFASLDVILFLVAMMIVIGFLEEPRFFEVVVEKTLAHLDRGAAAVGAPRQSPNRGSNPSTGTMAMAFRSNSSHTLAHISQPMHSSTRIAPLVLARSQLAGLR